VHVVTRRHLAQSLKKDKDAAILDPHGVRQPQKPGSEDSKETSTVLADPAKMIGRGAPRVIHNDQELEVCTDALFRSTSLENPSASEDEAIEC